MPVLERFLAGTPALSKLELLATDTLPEKEAPGWQLPAIEGKTVAFLQFTSGSTAAPKGVMVTHSNLMANERGIAEGFGTRREDVCLNWLPLYHDMGLIGTVLHALYQGFVSILMASVDFIRRPLGWLEAIDRHRATVCGAPNFAYELLAHRVTPECLRDLDLSSWRLAFNGAEPVRSSTLERFTRTFGPAGFRREAFYPCYGLAESTLFVTGGVAGEAPVVRRLEAGALAQDRVLDAAAGDGKKARTLVGCGQAARNCRIVIVDPVALTPCDAGRVGEIWVSGPSVTQGYWGLTQETEHAFKARLAGESKGCFLRTGDLGFLSDGELFVTGRLKDLLILRGRNHYPQDLEATVEGSHPALQPGGGAAFSVEVDGQEELVVVQEVARRHRLADPGEMIDAIRAAVARLHELRVHAVVLLAPGGVPKTSSGKVRRSACREAFLAGRLPELARGENTPTEDVASIVDGEAPGLASALRQLMAEVLGVRPEAIRPEQPLVSLGVDSLLAVDLEQRLEREHGVAFSVDRILGGASLEALIAEAVASPAAGSARVRPGPGTAPSGGIRGEDTAAKTEHALSQGQRALWFIHRLAPDQVAYHIVAGARVRSRLDAAALRRALTALADRHAALRTSFHAPAGEPLQRIGEAPPEFHEEDVSGLGADDLRDHLERWAYRPFDLEQGPLLRLALFTQPARDAWLVLSLHHLVADFWSLAVLAKDLGVLYSREHHRGSTTAKSPARAYSDYVSWQQEHLAGAEDERLWSYWREQLSGAPDQLDLPSDRARPPQQGFRGACQDLHLDAGLTEALHGLAQAHGATLYMTLLAAFQVLLGRTSGQRDLLVGSPSAGRSAADFADCVGYFVNPLVLRADLSGEPRFDELLGRVRETVLAAFAHQDYPFALLAERLSPQRDTGRSPLFQVMFSWQQAPRGADEGLAAFALGQEGARIELGGLVLESMAWRERASQFDLSLRMARIDGALVASLQYDSDLFDATTARRLLGHLRELLRSMADYGRRLFESVSLSAAEHQQLVSEWSSRRLPTGSETSVHELFDSQAERAPDAVALVCGRARLSFRDLHRQAGCLARRLRGRGVSPEVRVGLFLERSPELVVGMMAVLKAGGAYVALDPAYPRDRVAFMLADSGATLVLSRESLVAALPGTVSVVRADRAARAGANLEIYGESAAADNLAYVLYTSGSTGRPKGVAIPHRAAAALLAWASEAFSSEELANVLAATSICFDLSVFEIFLPLARGTTVVLVRDALELASLEGAGHLSLLNTVPSAMAELLRLGAVPPSVRTVNLAGEPLKRDLIERIYDLGTVERVMNLYGPSEDTTYSTESRIERGRHLPVTIGRPLPGTRAHLYDRRQRPVAIGVRAELCLGGAGLARGYLGRPALSAERFVPDPRAVHPGGRLYRTGDLARYLADGQLDYLGRFDHQVKLRGFRVELGEIEALLCRHPAVYEAVVVLRQDAPDTSQLVAYAECPRRPMPSAGELQSLLREKLPQHVVPSLFVQLEALPRTPNGKLDRSALLAPEPFSAVHVAPDDPVEETLAVLWAHLLKVERVGVTDDFFSLGGHSLSASRMTSRVREAFDVELPLRTLFEAPTVGAFAGRIREAMGSPGNSGPPLMALARDGDLPLSFAQERLWLLNQLEPESAYYNIPAAIHLFGPLSVAVLGQALGEIVRRHEALRTTLKAVEGRPVQVIRPAAAVVLPLVDLGALPSPRKRGEMSRLLEEEAKHPFDLYRGPLLRLRLLRLGPDEHGLSVNMHHVVSDGWSLAILGRELAALYRGERLAEPVVQYADFSSWQRRWLVGEVIESELAFWRRRLSGVPRILELPMDRPRPPRQSFHGAVRSFLLPGGLSTELVALGHREAVTPFMTLLAAFQLLLARCSGAGEILVGSPVAGRNRLELEGLIGCFVNTLVLRSDHSRDPCFLELLAQAREVVLEAHAHQEVPFEKLVEVLEPERDLSTTPLFQVAFALQDSPLADIELQGLALESLALETATAKFDLTLFLKQTAGALEGRLEYRRDLFDDSTIARMTDQLEVLVEGIVLDSRRRSSEQPLMKAAQRWQLLGEWNATAGAYPSRQPIHRFFEQRTDRSPDAVAASYGVKSLSYRGLNERANQLAHQLKHLGLAPGARTGVCMARSPELLVALLGTLKATMTYVPLEPAWPVERKRWILDALRVSCLLTGSSESRPIHELQWQLPRLDNVVFLDVDRPRPPAEPLDVDSVRELWDHVTESAVDWITAGGFVSSYTGQPFSAAEVDAYRDRVVSLVQPSLGPGKRVLEIGCGSGLILFEVAPRVARYVGADPSEKTQTRNRRTVARKGLDHVRLVTAFAHQSSAWAGEGPFDLVILASTIQFFPGPVYLEEVLRQVFDRLAPGGAVLLADVPDARRKEAFSRSLEKFRKEHRGEGLKTRSRRDELFYLDEDYFRDLTTALDSCAGIEVSYREGFANELGYRYDVLLKKTPADAASLVRPGSRRRKKNRWTRLHTEAFPKSRPPLDLGAEAMAYVIFTSGSTGNPKGVMVRHEPAANLIDWVVRTFRVTADDKLLFVTSPCFDLSVYDVFGTLAAGGSIEIASDADLRDPRRLAEMLDERSITFWDSAPASLQQLVPFFASGKARRGPGSLRLVLLSGDWIPVHLPDQVTASFPGARIVALGGATEATVWSNVFPVAEVDPGWSSIPYGRPIRNASYYLSGRSSQGCPIGVTGELFIGGSCLAAGYACMGATTAAKFVPDPFSARPGARLYRTGDLGRFLPDGNIEFLGRIDHQVKIRGFRIELGEIEVTLAQHPEVREAVVLVRDDLAGGRGLVAYVVARQGCDLAETELRDYLAERLPEHMVPVFFVSLDALPVTANGKLDREALPAPEATPGDDYIAPRTPVEEVLAQSFAEVLQLERVGVEDHFFQLGGHSLLATQLISRIRDVLAVELPVRTLFERPTVASFAEVVEPSTRAARVLADPIRPVSRQRELPLSFAQQRLWFLELMEPGTYNLGTALDLTGALDVAALRLSFEEILRRHEVLRTHFVTREGMPFQVVSPHCAFTLPIVELERLGGSDREKELERHLRETWRWPFDLGKRGALLRGCLLRLGARRHVLIAVLHHIAFDGWSFGVLVKEMNALYRAFSRGVEPRLPELAIQYADFACWQRERLQGEVFEAQSSYWSQQLAGARPLEFPHHKTPTPLSTRRGARHSLTLSGPLTEKLTALSRRAGVSLFMTLLAVFNVLLSWYTRQDEIVLGSETAARNRIEIEPLIGFFINILVLRTDLRGGPDFQELLARVRRVTLDAYAHQDLPFEKLLDSLDRGSNRQDLVRVIFAMENVPISPFELAGLEVSPREIDAEPAKFDLLLDWTELPAGLRGVFKYDPDLFETPAVVLLGEHLETLLNTVVEHPTVGVEGLKQILDDAEDRHKATRQKHLEKTTRTRFKNVRRKAIAV